MPVGQDQTDLDPECRGWPSEYSLQSSSWDYYALFDSYDMESFIHIYPGRYKISQGCGLYITEPELKDEHGDDVNWNYWE